MNSAAGAWCPERAGTLETGTVSSQWDSDNDVNMAVKLLVRFRG